MEAYYYLGNAYRINNQLEKAIDTYIIFKSKMNKDFFNVELVDRQIEACKNAMELQKQEVDFNIQNLGQSVNNKFSNFRPAISADNTTLAYTTIDNHGSKVIYICKQADDGSWGRPKNITEDIVSRGDCHVSAINNDGSIILIVKNDGFTADIYFSEYFDRTWTKMKKMSGGINSKYMETHASFSRDNMTIFFTSDRKESMGELDIFKSELNEKYVRKAIFYYEKYLYFGGEKEKEVKEFLKLLK